jgi:hypothetical protein
MGGLAVWGCVGAICHPVIADDGGDARAIVAALRTARSAPAQAPPGRDRLRLSSSGLEMTISC